MNVQEHLLAKLSEECVEVSKEIHKALSFGLEDTDPTIPGAATQRERIIEELNDVFAVIELLIDHGHLPKVFSDRSAIDRKKIKVGTFMAYAREKGALQ